MKNVLIVEDDRNISNAMRVRLSASGYEVHQAYDASTALMVAKQCDADLVVLDISMPGGDGFVVAERLRKWKGQDLPLVFITASQKPGLKERAAEFNAESFLEKPFRGQELCDVVMSAI